MSRSLEGMKVVDKEKGCFGTVMSFTTVNRTRGSYKALRVLFEYELEIPWKNIDCTDSFVTDLIISCRERFTLN